MIVRTAAVASIIASALALTGCQKAAPEKALIYVSDERGDRVVVVDPAAGKVVKQIAAGQRPRGIHLSSDGATLFVAVSGSPIGGPGVDESKLPPANHAADGIAVVDVASGTVQRVLKAGNDPETFVQSPDGKTIFVSNEDDSLVSAVDVAGALPTRQAKVGDEPEGVAISTDGARLFVASEASDTVTMLDAATLKVRTTTAIEGRPRGLLAAADGSVVYVSVELGGKLAVLSARDGKLLKSIDLAAGDKSMRPMGIVEAPGGKSLFITTGRHGSVLEVDPAAGRVVRSIAAVGARPWGIGTVDGGKLLVTANGPSGDISLVDRTSGAVTSRIKVGVSPWGMAVSKP